MLERKVVIVDDEPLARKRLRRLLEGRPGIVIAAEGRGGDEAVTAIQELAPDLVFLDVQMPDHSGFDVIETIGVQDMPAVVFVSAYDAYALEAFEVSAVDYLLKPFEDERFDKALAKALAQIDQRDMDQVQQNLTRLAGYLRQAPERQNYTRRLTVHANNRIYFVQVADIDWIGAEGPYVRLHTATGSHLIRDSLKRLETVLDPDQFVRIHRSTTVNIDRIATLHPHFHGNYRVVLTTGTTLKLSRRYRDQLKHRLQL